MAENLTPSAKGPHQPVKGKAQLAPKQQAPPKVKHPKQEDPPDGQDRPDDPSYKTVMLKNVPSTYTRKLLIMTLNEMGFEKLFDFLYLPLELKKKTLLGYAMINFISHETACEFRRKMAGYSNWLKDEDGNRL